jgi:hypothetical protein
MKGSFIAALLIVILITIIGLAVWREFKESAKNNEIKAIKEQVMNSIYIDSVRTRTVLDSLGRMGKKLRDQDRRLEAYNRTVRIQNIQTRKQNENLVIEIDSLRHSLDGRPDF